MVDPYYVRQPPVGPQIEHLSASFAKLFRSGANSGDANNTTSSSPFFGGSVSDPVPPPIVTQQPFGGSQISNSSSTPTLIPMNFLSSPTPHHPHSSPHPNSIHHHHHHPYLPHHQSQPPPQHPPPPPPSSTTIGIQLPGLEVLDQLPFIKVMDSGFFSGSTTCSPAYRVYTLQGELILRATTSKLFLPFDTRTKIVSIRDTNNEVIFEIRFFPSICECDSEEKRCFAIFSPLYENPFGAILFEAGQIKHSLRILNSLEGETFAVQFLSPTDISIKGADGNIVGIINILRKRGQKQRYTLTLTEEMSVANKALFTACIMTLDLVDCEATCSKCICLSPFLLACATITGVSVAYSWESKPQANPKP